MNSWSWGVLTLIPHTAGTSSLECLKSFRKPHPGCLEQQSFSKQTNPLLICGLQLSWRKALSTPALLSEKLIMSFTFHWSMSITCRTTMSLSATTTRGALVLLNKLLLQALILQWHDEVHLLLGSHSAPPRLNQSHFSITIYSLTFGSGFPWGQGGDSRRWTKWLRVKETGAKADAGREMYEWLQRRGLWTNEKKEKISRANHRELFFSPLQCLSDFFSWLLPGHCACPRLWIICLIGSVCLCQRAWLAA